MDPASRTVTGLKPFCSGLGLVDRALVTVADTNGRSRLVEVCTDDASSIDRDISAWSTEALRATATGTATFDGHPVLRVLGEPGWYLERPGFRHGAAGPAACWAGAAAGLVDVAELAGSSDPHRLVALGEMRAELRSMHVLLDDAAKQADGCFSDASRAKYTALVVSSQVARAARAILERFSQASGPRPFVSDPDVAQRFVDTHLYLRQHHGDADLAVLGGLDNES